MWLNPFRASLRRPPERYQDSTANDELGRIRANRHRATSTTDELSRGEVGRRGKTRNTMAIRRAGRGRSAGEVGENNDRRGWGQGATESSKPARPWQSWAPSWRESELDAQGALASRDRTPSRGRSRSWGAAWESRGTSGKKLRAAGKNQGRARRGQQGAARAAMGAAQ
jgi:hypothetical protein